jgi:phospholipid/cholesterol/gamma-HCH transport system permease protein
VERTSLDWVSRDGSTASFAADPTALHIKGALAFGDTAALWDTILQKSSPVVSGQRLDFEMSGVTNVDGGSIALLVHLRAELHRRGALCEFLGAGAQVQTVIHLYSGDHETPGGHRRRRSKGVLDQIGAATLALGTEAKHALAFFGSAVVTAGAVLRAPRSANWKELAPAMERAGADAIPIVLLINFLVGLVLAFQAAIQLRQFGANIYVADLVGLSICREMGPLMTAIILCGRSGAAFAAELGSMKVSEEIDALRTMGFGPMRFLVLPRTIALMLVMPILTLLGDAVGMLGGLVVGLASLDLTVMGYWRETLTSVHAADVFSGMLKSVVFAMIIALISCQQGLAASGGAEGVGRRTTSSVVAILFSIILADAAFTLLLWTFQL